MRRWTLRFADLVAVIAVIAAVGVIVQRLGEASGQQPAAPRHPVAAGDRDGDGVPDGEDLAPDTPGKARAESTPTPEAPRLPPADDCKRKGITRAKGGEGACYEPGGRRVRVVNRGTRLVLDELTAELRHLTVERHPTRRTATIKVTLRVRSKLDGIVDFRPEQAGLLVGRSLFPVDGGLESARAGSLVRRASGLKAGADAEGTLRFEVPIRAARRLDRDANLQILQFSDVSLASASLTVGVFRTYR